MDEAVHTKILNDIIALSDSFSILNLGESFFLFTQDVIKLLNVVQVNVFFVKFNRNFFEF